MNNLQTPFDDLGHLVKRIFQAGIVISAASIAAVTCLAGGLYLSARQEVRYENTCKQQVQQQCLDFSLEWEQIGSIEEDPFDETVDGLLYVPSEVQNKGTITGTICGGPTKLCGKETDLGDEGYVPYHFGAQASEGRIETFTKEDGVKNETHLLYFGQSPCIVVTTESSNFKEAKTDPFRVGGVVGNANFSVVNKPYAQVDYNDIAAAKERDNISDLPETTICYTPYNYFKFRFTRLNQREQDVGWLNICDESPDGMKYQVSKEYKYCKNG